MQNQRILKQIATLTVEGTRRRERPVKDGEARLKRT
jgi:hypothetical protein